MNDFDKKPAVLLLREKISSLRGVGLVVRQRATGKPSTAEKANLKATEASLRQEIEEVKMQREVVLADDSASLKLLGVLSKKTHLRSCLRGPKMQWAFPRIMLRNLAQGGVSFWETHFMYLDSAIRQSYLLLVPCAIFLTILWELDTVGLDTFTSSGVLVLGM
ncbi:hypothetical protein Tco_0974508 [Tanacetum coccineum]|uniref:Uncharacterized protein n=1 Tax=Tanacetum coccineum TaxID=301880 RepID=A0ABQ5EBW6_9ASTR